MLGRNNKAKLPVEQVINYAIFAVFDGLHRHTVIFVAQTNQLFENNGWIRNIDAYHDVMRTARRIMNLIIDGR